MNTAEVSQLLPPAVVVQPTSIFIMDVFAIIVAMAGADMTATKN